MPAHGQTMIFLLIFKKRLSALLYSVPLLPVQNEVFLAIIFLDTGRLAADQNIFPEAIYLAVYKFCQEIWGRKVEN